jgi:hypothetical protein
MDVSQDGVGEGSVDRAGEGVSHAGKLHQPRSGNGVRQVAPVWGRVERVLRPLDDQRGGGDTAQFGAALQGHGRGQRVGRCEPDFSRCLM